VLIKIHIKKIISALYMQEFVNVMLLYCTPLKLLTSYY
jgi:hypothetical protein